MLALTAVIKSLQVHQELLLLSLLLSFIPSVGPLCEYTENSGSEVIRQTCNTYDVYMSSLNFTCQPGQPGRLVWTPNDSTPDVVYYQVLNIIEYNISIVYIIFYAYLCIVLHILYIILYT